MTPTPDLKQALALVADTDRPAPAVTDDVARAHRAARARRRNRFQAGLAGRFSPNWKVPLREPLRRASKLPPSSVIWAPRARRAFTC